MFFSATFSSVAYSQEVAFHEDFNDAQLRPNLITEQTQALIDAGVKKGVHATRDGSHFMQSHGGEHVFTRVVDLTPPHSVEIQARLTARAIGNGEFISIGRMNDYGDEFYVGGIYSTD